MTLALVIPTLIVSILAVLMLAREYALLTEDIGARSAPRKREMRRPSKKARIPAGTLLKGAAAGFAAAAVSLPVGMAIGIVVIVLALAWLA